MQFNFHNIECVEMANRVHFSQHYYCASLSLLSFAIMTYI